MNHIEAAIMPLKADAVERAEVEAKKIIAHVKTDLAKYDWDLDKTAPYPNSLRTGRNEYKAMMSRHKLYEYITDPTWGTRGLRDPNTRKPSSTREAKYIRDARENAAAQYDAFVAKLCRKIGACDSAALTGSHVWGYSILTVTKGPTTERWQTQQIVNQSKLGTIFNQWPSRKLKR